MTIQWGSYETASSPGGTSGQRVGIEVTNTAVSNTSTTVTFTYKVYTQNYLAYTGDSQGLTFGGSYSGASSVSYSNSSATGAIVLRATKTYTYTYSSSSYGSSPGSVSFSATSYGAFDGTTASKSVSTAIPARPFGAPTAPTSVVSTRNSDAQATVTWTRTATTSKPYTSLTVQMATFTGSTWGAWVTVATTSATATSYVKTGLSANRVYKFQVRANNSVGSSAYVAPANSVWMTPAAPTGVTASINAGGTTITVNWTPQNYMGTTSTSQGFYVQRSVNGGAFATVATLTSQSASTWTDPTPGAGSNLYQVAAYETVVGSLTSTYTQSNTVTTIVPPLAPTLLSPNGVTVDLTQPLTLTWQHNPGGDGAPQSSFYIDYSSNGGSTWNPLNGGGTASTVSSYTVPGGTLANGTAYLWRVRTQGIASGGQGPNSASATFTGSSAPTITITAPTTTTASLPLVVTWTYAQAQSSAQSQWYATLLAADGVTVLESKTGTGTGLTTSFAYPAEDAQTYIIQVQSRSAAGLLSNVATKATTISLPVPAAVTIDPTYQPCTGTVVLHVEGSAPILDAPDRYNLIKSPTWRNIGGLYMRRNLASVAAATPIGSGVTFTTGVSYLGKTWTRVTVVNTRNGARQNVTLASLVNGRSYTGSVEVANDTATANTIALDWCDGLLAEYDLAPGESKRIAVQGSRSTYDSTYRFLDIVSVGTSTSFLMREIVVEEGAVASPVPTFFNGDTVDTSRIDYAWTGTAGSSESTATPANSEIRRNLATNPGLRTAAAAAVMRTNLATNPRAVAATGWTANNGASHTVTNNQPLPAVHPQGITTGSKSVVTGAAGTNSLGSWFNVDALGASATVRGIGIWAYAPYDADVRVYVGNGAGASNRVTTIPANTWTFCTTAGTDSGNAIVTITKVAGAPNAVAGDACWITGCISEATSPSGNFFDGALPSADGLTYAWTGTVNASTSTLTAQRPYGVTTGANGSNPPPAYRTSNPLYAGVSGYAAAFVPGAYIDWERTAGDAGNTRFVPGRTYTFSARVWKAAGADFMFQFYWKTSGGSFAAIGSGPVLGTAYNGERVAMTITVPASTDAAIFRTVHNATSGTLGVARISDLLIEDAAVDLGYFDGATQAAGGLWYGYVGTADASDSVAKGATDVNGPFSAYTSNANIGIAGWVSDTGVYRILIKHTTANPSLIGFSSPAETIVASRTYAGRVKVREVTSLGAALEPLLAIYNTGGSFTGFIAAAGAQTLGPDWAEMAAPSTAVASADALTVRWYIRGSAVPAGTVLEFKEATIEPVNGIGVMPGEYFDGSTPDTSTYSNDWTGTADASMSMADGRAEAAVVAINIERLIEGEDEWVTLVTGLTVPNDFIDPLPITNGVNTYRVTAVSAAPSYRVMEPVDVVGSDGQQEYGEGCGGLWAFVSYGPGFQYVLRTHSDLKISESGGRTRSSQPFLGRKKPGLLVGTNTERKVDLSATLHYDDFRPVDDDCRYDSPPADWTAMGREAELVCYRDYTGRRFFGMLSEVKADEIRWRILGALSLSVVETEYDEVYGSAE